MHVKVQTNLKLRFFESAFWLFFWNKQEWKKLVWTWILAVLLSLEQFLTKHLQAPRYLVCGVLSVLGLWNKELEGHNVGGRFLVGCWLLKLLKSSQEWMIFMYLIFRKRCSFPSHLQTVYSIFHLHPAKNRFKAYESKDLETIWPTDSQEEDLDGPPSAVNSPRSPRSGRDSPVSSHTGRSGGRSPKSSRSGAGAQIHRQIEWMQVLVCFVVEDF